MSEPRLEKLRLLNAKPIPEDRLALAEEYFKAAKRKLSLKSTVISSITISLCHIAFTLSDEIDTFAVKLAGDGQPMLMINVDFIIEIGPDDAVFALAHEAYHLLMRHLHVDLSLLGNKNWTTAEESCINRRVAKHVERPDLIRYKPPHKQAGQVRIVDPDEVYKHYVKGMGELNAKAKEVNPNAQDRPILDIDSFYKTDLGVFAALEELPKEIKPKNIGQCVHSRGGGGDGEGGGENPAPFDQDEVDKFVNKVLEQAVTEARNGHPKAKEEILGWMDAAPDSKQWGDLGAGVLRGETTKTRKTDLWEKWTADIVGSKLEDGNRLRYAKKIPWDPRVTPRGKQPKKYGAVYIDASGSMHQEVLDKVRALIGEMEDLEIVWHSFDGEIWPFVPGEPFRGGGGTSFKIIDDHAEDQDNFDEPLDFILVITDGYAPHIIPKDPNKWIWLITPGGDDWPLAAGMSCRQIDLPN